MRSKFTSPDVTIIIPTYNRPKMTLEAVRSALSQAPTTVEVIVVDDGSTDDTAHQVESTFGDRVVLVRSEKKGAPHARNVGKRLARGQYLLFLDSDDYLVTGVLSRLIASMASQKMDVCYGAWAIVHSNRGSEKSSTETKFPGQTSDPISSLLSGWWNAPFAYVYQKDKIKSVDWDESLIRYQDFDFVLRVAISGATFMFIDELVGYHCYHSGQRLTNVKAELAAENCVKVVMNATELLKNTGGLTPERKRRIADLLWVQSRFLIVDQPHLYTQIWQKISELAPRYKPQNAGLRAKLARTLGCRVAEQIFAVYLRLSSKHGQER